MVDKALPARGSFQEVVDLALDGPGELRPAAGPVPVLQHPVHLVNDGLKLHPGRALRPTARGPVIALPGGPGQVVVVGGGLLGESGGRGDAVVEKRPLGVVTVLHAGALQRPH